jgi:serine/threonine protein phosphatase PrpC
MCSLGGSLPIPPIPLACLVVCSDGVWDNWTYEDVTRFVFDSSCVNAVMGSADGARRVTVSFMQRNGIYAKRNFGSQADNATGILIYLSDSSALPTQTEA